MTRICFIFFIFALILAGCGGDDSRGSYLPGNDSDNDGIANAIDNCPNRANSDQLDSDSDGTGDVCENNETPELPTANAGSDQNVLTGELVTLDGSSSTVNNGAMLTYQWSITSMPASSAAALSDATLSNPTFSPDVDGQYVFELIVSDGVNTSSPDAVTVDSTTLNSAPTANAGTNQSVEVGETVLLDGTASNDANGDALSYTWYLTDKPFLSSAELTNSDTATPSFIADEEGDYVVGLIVNDGTEDSSLDSVTITATYANIPPVAEAGEDQVIVSGSTANLDGSQSDDADGDILAYSWSFLSMPDGSSAALSDPNSATPSFTTDLVGSYVVSLSVDDGEDTATDTVSITASEPFITLLRNNGTDFFQNYAAVAFPYDVEATFNASVSGIPTPTTYTLAQFKIEAVGSDFTVVSMQAFDNNGIVSPRFVGLAENDVLTEGVVTSFELETPLTNNQQVELFFTFTIQETGETFTTIYSGSTN